MPFVMKDVVLSSACFLNLPHLPCHRLGSNTLFWPTGYTLEIYCCAPHSGMGWGSHGFDFLADGCSLGWRVAWPPTLTLPSGMFDSVPCKHLDCHELCSWADLVPGQVCTWASDWLNPVPHCPGRETTVKRLTGV